MFRDRFFSCPLTLGQIGQGKAWLSRTPRPRLAYSAAANSMISQHFSSELCDVKLVKGSLINFLDLGKHTKSNQCACMHYLGHRRTTCSQFSKKNIPPYMHMLYQVLTRILHMVEPAKLRHGHTSMRVVAICVRGLAFWSIICKHIYIYWTKGWVPASI